VEGVYFGVRVHPLDTSAYPPPHKRLRSGYASKPRRSTRSDLAVGLEAFEQYLPLGLVLEEVPEESLLLGVVRAVLDVTA
jgi:hypothetical protein